MVGDRACQGGACVAEGGFRGKGACVGGAYEVGEPCVAGMGEGACVAGEMASAVDGMHPTGMNIVNATAFFKCNFVKLFTWCDCSLYVYIRIDTYMYIWNHTSLL